MAYSDFTLDRVEQQFRLNTQIYFLPIRRTAIEIPLKLINQKHIEKES